MAAISLLSFLKKFPVFVVTRQPDFWIMKCLSSRYLLQMQILTIISDTKIYWKWDVYIQVIEKYHHVEITLITHYSIYAIYVSNEILILFT